LVLQFRSSGVVNFALGAIAMFIAYVYVQLRSAGRLVFPWVILPHSVTLDAGGFATVPAMAISLAYAAIFGLLLYLIIFRPLLAAEALAKVCAAVGLMIALQGIAVLNFGTNTVTTPPILPTATVTVAGIPVPSDRFYLTGIAIVLACGLGALYRFTRFGIATRAGAENQRAAALLAISPNRIAAQNWIIATVLAGLAGILLVPIVNLDPGSYTLLIVPALGAALAARFRSFGVAVAVGLVIGMLQSELLYLQTIWTWLPQSNIQEAVPFILVIVAMAVFGRGFVARGEPRPNRSSALGRPTRPLRVALLALAVGVLALELLHGYLRAGMITSLVSLPVCLSLVVLTGYCGQISMAQVTFAGIGGFTLSHVSQGLGIPFPWSLLLAALIVVPVGLFVGLPAVRVRGINLAVITLAMAVVADALVFQSNWFAGGIFGRSVPAPHLFGLNLGIAGSSPAAYPRATFGVFVLVVDVLLCLLVAWLRMSSPGRKLIAVRSNERAASAAGINVARTKLAAFSLSAFIAAIGGGLLAYQQGVIAAGGFGVFLSLTFLAIAYVGGIGRISGAIAAAVLLAPASLGAAVLDKIVNYDHYQVVVAGVLLMISVITLPNGLASTWGGVFRLAPMRWYMDAPTPDFRRAVSSLEAWWHAAVGSVPTRRRTALAGLVTATAVVAVAAVVVGVRQGASASHAPTVGAAAQLVDRPATQPAPDGKTAELLDVSYAGITYPNYASSFGATPTGERVDAIAGREARTVFYRLPDGSRLSYTIFSGDPVPLPEATEEVRFGGVALHAFSTVSGLQVVTVVRSGRTCVLAGRIARSTILRLAERPLVV
jgi:ABC-type branched-subunit amino acid transport system permease subunit